MHIDEPGRIAPIENLQPPRHRGLAAVELLVEIIPQSADSLREDNAGGDGIAKGRKRNSATATGDPRPHTAEGDRTPDAQTAIPNTQRGNHSRAAFAEIRPPISRQVV